MPDFRNIYFCEINRRLKEKFFCKKYILYFFTFTNVYYLEDVVKICVSKNAFKVEGIEGKRYKKLISLIIVFPQILEGSK